MDAAGSDYENPGKRDREALQRNVADGRVTQDWEARNYRFK